MVWLTKQPAYSEIMTERLVESLRSASSFYAGRDAAERLEEMSRQAKLSSELLDAIADAYVGNNQLYPNHIGGEVIIRILEAHGHVVPVLPDSSG